MDAKQKLHQANLIEWAARCNAQKESGLTVRQWCEQNHLSIHKYNYWKHLLKEDVVDRMIPEIVPLSMPQVTHPDNGMPDRANCTNCAIRTTFPDADIKLVIDGVSLVLESSVPEAFLRTLVRAVHYA